MNRNWLYRQFLGYRLNVEKTQVLIFNWNHPRAAGFIVSAHRHHNVHMHNRHIKGHAMPSSEQCLTLLCTVSSYVEKVSSWGSTWVWGQRWEVLGSANNLGS